MRRFRFLLHRRAVEEQLEREVRFHFEQLVEDNIAGGMKPAEARRKARIEFGGLEQIKEDCRDARRFAFIDTTLQDLRYALRFLRKSPAFTAVAVLSLALGIGANSAIFSVVDTLMLKALPVRSPEELVSFTNPGGADIWWGVWPYGLLERSRTVAAFTGVVGTRVYDRYNLSIEGKVDPGRVRIGLVSGNYFEMLGIGAAIGRPLIREDDGAAGAHPVAVLSHGYWKRRFASDPGVVGRTVALYGTRYDIAGVAEAGFAGDAIGQPVDLWIPLAMRAQVLPERPGIADDYWGQIGSVRMLARLRPGVSMAQAQAEESVVYQQFRHDKEETLGARLRREKARPGIRLLAAASGYAPEREEFAEPLRILMMVVGVVLLIACANVASLLVARSAARDREMAVRLAMGAGRGRILRQLLTESVLLAVAGGALGLVLARYSTRVLMGMLGQGLQPVDLEVHADVRVLAFTLVVSVMTGLLFGMAPAFRAAGVPAVSLAMRGSGARPAPGLGRLLMAAQIALALVLLASAGLFVRTLVNLRTQDFGFDRQHLLLLVTDPGQTGRQGPMLANLYRTIRERVAGLPGVVAASQTTDVLDYNRYWVQGSEKLTVQGQLPKAGLDWTGSLVAPQFFATMGIPLLVGRDFTERDTTLAPGSVAIVNATLARFLFERENPIGQHLGRGTEIIGVVNDSKSVSPRDRNLGILYSPVLAADVGGPLCLAVRTSGDPASVAASIRREVREIDPTLPVLKVVTMDQQLDEALGRERLIAGLSGFFSVLALLLVCLGLYGTISYSAERRIPEIGIRIALGATRANVLGMVLRESGGLVAAGVAAGWIATVATTRLVSSWLFQVDAADPIAIGSATVLIVAVALAASFVPARRASRVDPTVALRYE